MTKKLMPVGAAVAALAVAIVHLASPTPEVSAAPVPVNGKITQGALLARGAAPDQAYECPLRHTDVKAEISGFISRVTVTQEFENTGKDKIEAVYVFPLPHRAAVDDMTMMVGDRSVKGLIKRREEAQAIYQAARNAGKIAGLLDQERPNIFTQQVANIGPGTKVKIVISYVETLKYEAGTYEFAFPMVVGPRYIPGTPTAKFGDGWSYDTDKVPDASRITPYVTKPGTRAGHDISVRVSLDAGVPIGDVSVPTHEVEIEKQGVSRAAIVLKNRSEIPNKDLLLRYKVASGKIADAVLTHRGDKGGFFTLFLQPPDKLGVEEITPKELVFVLDTSGSMSGFPIEKAKETMRLAIDALNPSDTFNLITFSGDTHILWPQPKPASRDNIRQALEFLQTRQGGGGTAMMKAVKAALAPSESQKHVRIVCFMTDGYIGNEAEIISEIGRYSNARIFSFGIGQSVNRYLLDKMSEAGRGEVEYVSLKDDGSAAAKRFHERVRNPLLTDISIDWNGLPVTDVYPARIPDLFSAKPLVVTGRFSGPAKGSIKLRGNYAGRPIVREVALDLPVSEPKHDVLASLWARTKIDSIMHDGSESKAEITRMGLEYKLMTPFTSFVAVEETVITEGGGAPRRIQVPIEMPEGVSYEGVFGETEQRAKGVRMNFHAATPPFVAPRPQATYSGVLAEPAAADGAIRSTKMERGEGKLSPDLRRAHLSAGAQDGSVRVQVFLSDTSDSTIAELKRLGLEVFIRATAGKSVIGKITVARLETLAKSPSVLYIDLVR